MLIPESEIVSKYEAQVQRGIDGKNIGLELDKNQYSKLTKYIANIQQGRFDLIGAPTGCGKSTLALDMYMVNPIRFVEANPSKKLTLKILYFNMELPVQNVVAKYVARRIYELSAGETRLSVNKIFQKGVATASEIKRLNEVGISPALFKRMSASAKKYGGKDTLGLASWHPKDKESGEKFVFRYYRNFKFFRFHDFNTFWLPVSA